jgi:flagellar motility protein MotE (MotC chaperone)
LKRRLSFLGVLFVFSVLIMAKVFLSGVYLKSGSLPMPVVKVALAEEKTVAGTGVARMDPQQRDKETELRAREENLRKKEAELLPLKEEVDSRIAELNELQEKLTVLARQLAEKEKAMKDEKMGHLVSLYSAMDPAKAAAIMDKLKIQTVVLILRHMKGKSAGQILAMMEPEKGAVISEELTNNAF